MIVMRRIAGNDVSSIFMKLDNEKSGKCSFSI